MTSKIRTVADFEKWMAGFYPNIPLIRKADDPLLSTTAGYWQALFGKKAWLSLNLSANAFACIPKEVWTQSGWRVITTAAAQAHGIDENGNLPDTDKPDIQTVSAKPKDVVHHFRVTEKAEFLSTIDDGLGSELAFMREYYGKQHPFDIDKMFFCDSGVVTYKPKDFESLDRVCCSYDERTNAYEADQSTSYTTDDADIYGLDRDTAASFADAKVLHASKGALRALSLDLIDQLFEVIRTAGGVPKVMITGFDTARVIAGLLQAQQRFVETARVAMTFGGVKTLPGLDVGFEVAAYNGVPIIPDQNCLKDTGGLSRIYLLDTDYLRTGIAKPTQYIETSNFIELDALASEGIYRTSGELRCYFFGAQGKLRDIKAP